MAETIQSPKRSGTSRLAALLSDHVFLLLVIAYVVGAIFPTLGQMAQAHSIGKLPGSVQELKVSTLFLAALLFAAGLGIERVQFAAFVKRPLPILAGVLAKVCAPLLAALLIAQLGSLIWPDSPHWMVLVTGLFLIAALPVATATMGWAHHAHGNLALSIALLGISTLLSPLTTPLGLHVANWVVARSESLRLMEFSHEFASTFMISAVLAPALAGAIVSAIAGRERIIRAQPVLKLISLGSLIALNYINASVALPEMLKAPDPSLLAQALTGVLLLCGAGFLTGVLVARATADRRDERLSVLFALGMCNNGAGLVFATLAAPKSSIILLPLLLYNLVQHLFAGIADRFARRRGANQHQSTTS